MSRPLVSVIIPTRNRADLLPATIAALQGQIYPELEIIIVDDGSSDATAEVIEQARRRDTRIRSLRHESGIGAAAARNTGAAAARGEYLLFEDDDCRGHPDRVTALVAALERCAGAAYAYCWLLSKNTDGSTTVHAAEVPWSIGTPCALVRSDAFHAAGGFDARLPRLQDFDLWIRLLARSGAVAVPRVLLETVRDDQGITASRERFLAAAERILEKYRDSDLPRRHLSDMHRWLGGKLMVNGFRREGRAHLRRSVRLRKHSLRSWLALAAASGGPRTYRAVARANDGLKRVVTSREE